MIKVYKDFTSEGGTEEKGCNSTFGGSTRSTLVYYVYDKLFTHVII